MHKIIFIFSICAAGLCSFAQPSARPYHFVSSGNLVQDKNFYLLTLLQNLPDVNKAIIKDSLCSRLYNEKSAIATGSTAKNDILRARFSELRITQAKAAIGHAYAGSKQIQNLVKTHLRPSRYFVRFAAQTDSLLLVNAMEAALNGINNVIDVYGLGKPGRYPKIDSGGFRVENEVYITATQKFTPAAAMAVTHEKLFFGASLLLAMKLLQANNRNEAARYEPLETGENKAAFAAISKTDFSRYPYAAILVPGLGPAGKEALSAGAKKRLEMAVTNYKKGLSSFIMVSGGNVHPWQTPYNEAVEMKKELMQTFKIPESHIIIEPHARHTTTNLRNCNRLYFRYGFPTTKKVLITTDSAQAFYITTPIFAGRCISDMGHQPFKELKNITGNDIEYLPVISSLYMDASDPLDP